MKMKNREIKFRGKRIDNGEWIYGVPVKTNYGISIIQELYHVDGAEYNAIEYGVIPESVGEYTGLKDKNGKEIYEGDILKQMSESAGVMDVRFEEGSYVTFNRLQRWGLLSRAFDPDISQRYAIEVIGNIYDNPELLNP